ncbi:MAG TPA: Ig-like domain-containing protein [Gemmatimonadaceae bacterium]|nr:Ig-like domain-containing protein [Gemmatimonadaceae bacterium]
MARSFAVSGRLHVLAALALLTAAGTACSDDEITSPDAAAALTGGAGHVLVGAGNIARCDMSIDEATARLLDAIPGTVFTAGDNTYDSGTLTDISTCFGASWGRHKSRIRPSAGDREFSVSGASGYFGYFGAAAGPTGKGYYSYDLGDWHVVVLNSSIATSAGSAQEQWLRADLAASTKPCTIAYWHYPRFSSFSTHTRASVKPLWDALYAAGAEIVVNGHYRFYERYAPQSPTGQADPKGIRQFIVGTGGTGQNPFDTVMPNSEVRKTGIFGVLKLTLGSGTYAWEFVPVAGQTFTDQGTGTCNGAASTTSNASSSVALTPSSIALAVGTTAQLTAVTKDASGNVVQGGTMGFKSLNTSVATVSASGVVTGIAIGVTYVVATSGGASDTTTVTVTPSATRAGYYVSPSGSSANDGSYSRPWNLTTALAGAGGRVQPGDTVWVRGGTYKGNFRSTVAGRSGASVVIRAYPGERAILDGNTGTTSSAITVSGPYTVLWGLEVVNSSTTRSFSTTSSHSRQNGVVNYASNTKYVNLVVHDAGVAFYTEPMYTNVEIVGGIFYNNGWQSPTRGHGHALYLKSNTGPVIVRDNVMFNQYGYGVHVYSNAGSGMLNNIQLEGNVAFNNGTLSSNSTSPNILIGGEATATANVLRNNFTYFTPGTGTTNVRVGYSTVRNGSVQLNGNYFVGGAPVLDFGYWSSTSVSGNTFVGPSRVVHLNDASTSGKSWSGNLHQRDPLTTSWRYGGQTYTFAAWKTATRLAATDQAASGLPAATRVFVRQNPYETGRAMVVVYNWGQLGAVSANLSGILNVGDRYVVRSVQNFHGAPVASGTYGGGSVSIPVNPQTAPAAIGGTTRAPSTGRSFDVFIVTRG